MRSPILHAFRFMGIALVAGMLLACPQPCMAKRLHGAMHGHVNGPSAPPAQPQLATEPVPAAPGHASEAVAPENAEHAEAAAHEAGHEEGSGGLPQLDIARFPGQLLWLSLTFILTFVLMRFVALPKVNATIGAREDKINSDVAAARNKSEDMKRLTTEYETRLARARGDAVAATRKVNDEAAAQASAALSEQAGKINTRLKEAEAKLAAQKTEAMANLDKEMNSVVADILRGVAGLSVPAAAIDSAMKKAGGV